MSRSMRSTARAGPRRARASVCGRGRRRADTVFPPPEENVREGDYLTDYDSTRMVHFGLPGSYFGSNTASNAASAHCAARTARAQRCTSRTTQSTHAKAVGAEEASS